MRSFRQPACKVCTAVRQSRWASFCQFLKQQVHRVLVFLVVLQYLHGIEHFQQSSEVLFLHRGFIMQIRDQCGQKQSFGLFPERVSAGPFALGVGHQGRDQFQNILFAVDIGEGVVVHRLFEVDGVQNPDLVAVLQHRVATFKHDSSFRVSNHIGTVTL